MVTFKKKRARQIKIVVPKVFPEELLGPREYLHKIVCINLGKLHNKYGRSHKNNLIVSPK